MSFLLLTFKNARVIINNIMLKCILKNERGGLYAIQNAIQNVLQKFKNIL